MRKFILIVFVLLSIPASVVGWYATRLLQEHYHGKAQWEAWKRERMAKGDVFEWKAILPPDVPDADNFAKAPLIAEAMVEGGTMSPRLKALGFPENANSALGDWKLGTSDDLVAFAKACGARDIWQALVPFEIGLKELEEASRRSRCKLTVDYAEGQIPTLPGLRGPAKLLRLRALANLERGEGEAALRDLQTIWRLSDHLKGEPHLMAILLREALVGFSIQVVWQGLEEHRWKLAQLAQIQESLSRMDLLESYRLAIFAERLNFQNTFICMAEGKPQPKYMRVSKDVEQQMSMGKLPKGWIYRNILEQDRYWAGNHLDTIDVAGHRVYPSRYESAQAWVEHRKYRKDLILALIAIPALDGQIERLAQRESAIDLAVTACALERYRLLSGVYPEQLAELSPRFLANLPADLITGDELHYSRKGDHFHLYSVGWNGKDDSGTLAWKDVQGKNVQDIAQGDWVWSHQ